MAAFGLSQGGQNAEHMATAQTAAFSVFEIIDRVPVIDTQSDLGEKLENPTGIVEFKNVSFKYPARTDQEQSLNSMPHAAEVSRKI